MSPPESTYDERGRPARESNEAPGDPRLSAEIEAALKPGARRLVMTPGLEQLYQDRTWYGRSRSLKTWLYVVALINFLCIGIDAVVMPAHLTEAVIARGLILTPLYLGAAILLSRQRPPWVQGLAILVPTVSIIAVAGYLAQFAGGVHTERYLVGGLFTLFAATIVPNVALRWIAAQAVLSLLVFGALLPHLNLVNGAPSLLANIELLTFFPVSILVALHVRRWIERMHRRNFLMMLRDELRVQDLALSKARRDATLENMSQGIVMRETDGLIPVINRRAIELLGLPEKFLHGPVHSEDVLRYQRSSGELDDPTVPAAVAVGLKDGDGTDIPMVYERTRPNGIVLEIRTTRLPDGRIVRTFSDVTERKNTEIALSRARDAAEAASHTRSEFLAMMSHEIRTPMNAVLGLTGSLLESSLDADQRRAAEAIQEASDGLLNILNDILDLSKLDTGKLEFEQMPFSIESVIDNTRSIVGLRATEKGLTLSLDIDPKMPKAVIGDPSRVRQIVLNLASNAVKFTQAGNVVISARCVERSATHATIRIAVKDSGIGIAQDRLGQLFSDFVQADASIHRKYGGTGLGLAICKRLVDQMNGTIAVESTLGRGATFSFEVAMPLADVSELEQRGSAELVSGLGATLARLGRPLRVLIAEDNATNQLVVTRMLREFNIDLRIAQNGIEAVAAASHGDFDAIFMDMRMPEMDGLEATRAIRQHGGALATIPIIALTANAFADDVKACRDAGMSDFVAKPIRKRLLVETLAKVAQSAAPAKPGSTIPSPVTAVSPAELAGQVPEEEGALIDRSVVAELSSEIGAVGASEILQVFLEETRMRLAVLAQLSREGDRGAIEVEAHTLKGAAGALGFARVAALAKALELDARAAALFANPFAEDYGAQVKRIGTAFRDSCQEMDARPLFDKTAA